LADSRVHTIEDGKEERMAIEFKCEPITVEVLDPGGSSLEHRLERRFDPLTSHSSLVCPNLREKFTGFYGNRDDRWLEEIAKRSELNCPFCRPMIEKVIPKFREDQVQGGVLRFEDVYVFPNLFPRTEFEAVVTSPEIHYLSLDGFTEERLYNFLTAAFHCVRMVHSHNNNLAYPVVGTNYLPPAGASLIHFHQQIAIQRVPFNRVRNLIELSTRYAEAENSNFWQDYIAINDERKIKQVGNVYWHVPFAPTGFCEVQAIVDVCNFLQFEADGVRNIALGLSNVLKYYHYRGFDSFNCVIYSGSLEKADSFRAGLSIVARPNALPNYLSIDSWFMPLMLRETVVPERPEDVVSEIRKYF
jgi:UDPglucose--hexose-1-phosphate uridylyltransferase